MLIRFKIKNIFPRCFLASLLAVGFISNASAVQKIQHEDYVGSKECSSCHKAEFEQWQTSHHAKSMMSPTAKNILGNFNNKKVTFAGVTSSFSKSDKGYFITTQNAESKMQTYKVEYTFGYIPLQQYLIDIGDGKFQAFDIAWDSRSKKEGGQRWFKLLPNRDTSPDSSLHWSRQSQNWNSRCAECHSTSLEKGYDSVKRSYNTTFTEVNVACESCHGAGKKHVGLMRSGKKEKDNGFLTNLAPSQQFVFNTKGNIAMPQGKKSTAQIDACGGCHSRREKIAEANPASDYHDQYSLRLLDDPLYHLDGQIQDEVFVLGSFLQSKMHKAGVTCTNCHNAHTGEVKAQDNSLCTQCHKVEAYDSKAHHNHKASSSGALCINCHMPATTYMEVDDRRDHSFSIPTPLFSEKLNTPNACTGCHQVQSAKWASAAIQSWPSRSGISSMESLTDYFALINAKALNGDTLGLKDMLTYVRDTKNPVIKQATLLSLAGGQPSKQTINTILMQLKSTEPLLRRAAVEASHFLPLEHRWTVLKDHITDPSTSVRHAVAVQLAGHINTLQGADHVALNQLLKEYEKQLSLSQDMPEGQVTIALYKKNRGDIEGALAALVTALEIEPDFLPALLNIADMYRGLGDKEKVRETLERAIAVAPNNGAIQHSFGLFWIRSGQVSIALEYLKAATEQSGASMRYFYVYAVALDSEGRFDDSIAILEQATQLWPNQQDLLTTLVLYLDKAGRAIESGPYLDRLLTMSPNDPEIKRRAAAVKKLQENKVKQIKEKI